MSPEAQKTAITRFGPQQHVAGVLCLDFVNTVDWRGSATPHELLTSYGDLLIWCAEAGLISAPALARLVARAGPEATTAATVLHRAIALREAIHRLVQAARHGHALAADDLDLLNAELAAAPARERLVLHEGRAVWDHTAATALDAMLAPIARSAAELLTGDRLDRVKQCGDEACGWLFLDMSRSRRRRWCRMEGCGNRAKARRHYKRKSALKRAEC